MFTGAGPREDHCCLQRESLNVVLNLHGECCAGAPHTHDLVTMDSAVRELEQTFLVITVVAVSDSYQTSKETAHRVELLP